jgi:thioredoxin 1
MFGRLFGRKPPPLPPSQGDTSGGARPAPGEVTDATWDARLQAPGLTVVDFWADWCQPCTVMSAYVEFLARDFSGQLQVLALDVDENPRTSEAHNVMGLPTLIYFRDGVEVHRTTGVTDYNTLKRETARLLNDELGVGRDDG